MNNQIRVRFAPSPTGVLHVGSLRTALFNWLYAKGDNEGKLVLRVEDTDSARSTAESETAIFNGLTRLGLTWDEGPDVGGPYGPYRQSERTEIHKDALDKLVKSKNVYRCFCTKDELEKERKTQIAAGKPPRYSGKCSSLTDSESKALSNAEIPFSWRFKVSGTFITFKDGVRGRVSFKASEIGDFIVARSDGSFLYLLAAAVDDMTMKITDVIRGEDHLSNTPKQMLIIEALGATAPNYHHLPIIVDESGKKLSKRDGAFDVSELLDNGFQPEAIVAAIATLGWSGASGEKVDSLTSMASRFDISKVSKSGAKFDAARLDHLNVALIKELSGLPLIPIFKKNGLSFDDDKKVAVAKHVAETIKRSDDALEYAKQFAERLEPDDRATEALSSSESIDLIKVAVIAVENARNIKSLLHDAVIESVKTETGAKGKLLFQPLRAAITGRLTGPNLRDLFEVLGADEISKRLKETIDR